MKFKGLYKAVMFPEYVLRTEKFFVYKVLSKVGIHI